MVLVLSASGSAKTVGVVHPGICASGSQCLALIAAARRIAARGGAVRRGKKVVIVVVGVVQRLIDVASDATKIMGDRRILAAGRAAAIMRMRRHICRRDCFALAAADIAEHNA